MNDHNNKNKTVSKILKISKIRFLSYLLILLLFILSLSLIILTTTIFLTNFPLFNSANHITLPKGYDLYDLKIHTFRNNSLYRYDSKPLILSSTSSQDYNTRYTDPYETDENDIVLLTTTKHSHENMFLQVSVEGECNCYIDDIENNNRRVGGLAQVLYSNKIAAMVVVSAIGLATAKFVNDHIEGCYDAATRMLGNEDPFTCSVEGVRVYPFGHSEEQVPGLDCKDESQKHWRRRYECNGHCVKNWKLSDERSISKAVDFDCESKFAGTRVVWVYEDPGKEDNNYLEVARKMYRDIHLIPFCWVQQEFYLSDPFQGQVDKHYFRPCWGFEEDMKDYIFCHLLSRNTW